jgi:phosphatidylglycerophosphate synthase
MISAILLAYHTKIGRPRCMTKLCGLTLVERVLKMLHYQGIEQVGVIIRPGSGVQEHLGQYSEDLRIEFLELEEDCVESDLEALHLVKASMADQVLAVRADFVYDSRAINETISASKTTLAVGSRPPRPEEQLIEAEGGETYFYGLSLLSREFLEEPNRFWPDTDGSMSDDLLRRFDNDGVASLLRLDQMPTYLVNLRRSLPVACFTVESDSDVRSGEDILMDGTQKGTLDFPAQYLHPLPENWITRRLLDTPITPNIVTVISNLLAFLGVWFFWEGEMVLGLASASVVGVLDGVDGKLARLKLMYSKFGDKLDHVLDLIYEPLWYLAIGGFLSSQADYSDLTPVYVSAGIVAFYFLDRIATGTFKLVKKIELFDYASIDRLVRKLGARRNTNVLLLLVGVLACEMAGSLWAIVLLTVATTVFHCFRALQLSLRRQ